jgi:Uri superfamily endonuclease
LLEKSWREFRFPKSHRHGVYFIFGRKKSDDSFLGVYVGKASHNSYMCRRLSTHLNNSQKQDKIYLKKDYHHVEFLLEFVLTIPMELIFMAPALEEFLIYNLQKQGVKMINSIGNTQLEDIGFIWT